MPVQTDPRSSRDSSGAPFEGLSPVAQPLSVTEDHQWATLAHFGGVAGFLPSFLIHRVFRGRGRFTEQESKEAMNFTLLPTLVVVVGVLLAPVPYIGWFFALAATAAWLLLAVGSLAGGIGVNRGDPHVYRFNTRLYDRLEEKLRERSVNRTGRR
ncbi:DUF4870 domain-containing protein [Kocuria sp. M1R5S2]|uniref:DUF4870 domain-containing protein n=1 Tax=Kocuria rhizosphaerae TaxID=3376285 RepID=UPI00379D8A25